MGNNINKDKTVVTQYATTEIKDYSLQPYLGWIVVVLLVVMIATFFICRYGLAKIRHWLLKQVDNIQERAVQMAQVTRASIRKVREQPKQAAQAKIEIF